MDALHVTNATSRRAPFRGPGRVWTIMAMPRAAYGELGDGPVPALVPAIPWVRAAKAGDLPLDDYRALYVAHLRERADLLRPGVLAAASGDPVAPGDTLVCACSRADAANGRCHRVWCAHVLAQVGWSILLDGVPVGT